VHSHEKRRAKLALADEDCQYDGVDYDEASRMLKKSASIVLASFRPSTYPRGYASGLHSLRPCWTAFLSILQECFSVIPHVRSMDALVCEHSFSAAC
jgi:hypothetical protein